MVPVKVGSTYRTSHASIAALLSAALVLGVLAPSVAFGAPGDRNTIGLGTSRSTSVAVPVSVDDKLVVDQEDAGTALLLTANTRQKAPAPKPVAPAPAPAPAPKPAPKPASEPKPAPAPAAAAPVVEAAPVSAPAAAGDWLSGRVSWYGPGFYGNKTASGMVLEQNSMIVAHRSLAFGTTIEFSYNGRTCVATVQDRGPRSANLEFDLGPGVRNALGFDGVGTVEYRFL